MQEAVRHHQHLSPKPILAQFPPQCLQQHDLVQEEEELRRQQEQVRRPVEQETVPEEEEALRRNLPEVLRKRLALPEEHLRRRERHRQLEEEGLACDVPAPSWQRQRA